MKQLEKKSISFKGAFVIVIALHIVVVLAIIAFSNIKKNAKELLAKQETERQDREFITREDRNEWPQANQKPKVVATIPKIKKQEQTSMKVSSIIIPIKPSKSPPLSVPVLAQTTPKPTPKPMPKRPSSKQTAIAKSSTLEKSITDSLNKWQSLAISESVPKNVQTFAKSKVEKDSLPNEQPARQKTYVLESGDNLYMVSKRLNVSFDDLVKANNIRDVRDLYAGLALKIP